MKKETDTKSLKGRKSGNKNAQMVMKHDGGVTSQEAANYLGSKRISTPLGFTGLVSFIVEFAVRESV